MIHLVFQTQFVLVIIIANMKNIALTTFAVFMVEGIIHYNMGKDSNTLPSKEELFKIAMIVGIFSIINGMILKNK